MRRDQKRLYHWGSRRLPAAWLIAVGGLLMHLAAASVWAQKPGRIADEDGGILQWVIAGVLALLVCIPAFINPKRSHLT